MPTDISMMKIEEAGRNLSTSATDLTGGIRVALDGSTMVIKENGREVFTMKEVSITGAKLVVDRPHVAAGEGKRGWGIMGMLIALYHGYYKGCTAVRTGTEIESTSRSYWGKFHIGGTVDTPLLFALNHGIEWVLGNCRQEDRVVTSFVLLDGEPTKSVTRKKSV